jgi:hypothetical protein
MRRPSAVSVRCAGGPAWHLTRVTLWALAAGSAAGWTVGQVWAHADRLPGLAPVAAAAAHPTAPDAPTLALLVALGTAIAAAGLGWRWLRPPVVELGWDGAAWRLSPAGAGARRPAAADAAGEPGHDAIDAPSGTLTVAIDLGRWMLLRWQPEDGRPRWIAAAAGEVGPAWHALRVAAFGTAGAPGPGHEGSRPSGIPHV